MFLNLRVCDFRGCLKGNVIIFYLNVEKLGFLPLTLMAWNILFITPKTEFLCSFFTKLSRGKGSSI